MTDLSSTAKWHFFHRWSNWTQYDAQGTHYGLAWAPIKEGVPYSQRRQRRHCLICGKEQDEFVKSS